MNWKTLKAPFKALVLIAVCAISVWAVTPVQQKIHLGLDLQGGARLLLQLSPTASVPVITPQVQAQTRQVIDRRIKRIESRSRDTRLRVCSGSRAHASEHEDRHKKERRDYSKTEHYSHGQTPFFVHAIYLVLRQSVITNTVTLNR